MPLRILYLEDNEVFASQVCRLFLADHAITLCPDLSSARATITGDFDLIIADYDLPDGKGDAFVRECRGRFPKIPIIAASSHGEGNAALKSAGARAICGKLEFDQIGEVLAKLGLPT